MLMKWQRGKQARSGFCSCIINGKASPLCLWAMFDNVLIGPGVQAGAQLYKANLFSLSLPPGLLRQQVRSHRVPRVSEP